MQQKKPWTYRDLMGPAMIVGAIGLGIFLGYKGFDPMERLTPASEEQKQQEKQASKGNPMLPILGWWAISGR